MDQFQKIKKEYKNLKKQEIHDTFIKTNYVYKACFQHDMAYGYFKDLTRRIASDKILHNKAFNMAKNPKYYRYLGDLASVVYKFFDKKTFGSCIKNGNIQSRVL